MFKDTETSQKIQELEIEGYKPHHTAYARGYLRKDANFILPYKGKFGRGYIVHYANRNPFLSATRTCQYHFVEYYIKTKEERM